MATGNIPVKKDTGLKKTYYIDYICVPINQTQS